MAATLAQVSADALMLSPEERVRLAQLLWDSVPEEDDAPPGPSWEEIKRRIKEIDDGAETFDADEVIAEIRQELAASQRKVA